MACPIVFCESFSALTNTEVGTIILGVAEKPTGSVWEGVPAAAQLRALLWGKLNDRHKISRNLLSHDVLRTAECVGHHFVVVNAPRASRLQPPVLAA